MDEVLLDLEREVAAQQARRCLDRIGRAHQRARGLDRARTLHDEGDQVARS